MTDIQSYKIGHESGNPCWQDEQVVGGEVKALQSWIHCKVGLSETVEPVMAQGQIL